MKLKKKTRFLKVASCVVLLIIPAQKAQSLAHDVSDKIMAAGSLQSKKREPPGVGVGGVGDRQGSGQEGRPLPGS